jgi:ketosteroid isomerase-like protein
MRKIRIALALVLMFSPLAAFAQTDDEQLTAMLHTFLSGASRNDSEAHDRFWDEDLVYTSSAGKRFGKAEILEDLRASAGSAPAEAPMVYSAEDIRLRVYGDAAVVAFRLIGASPGAGGEPAEFFNTGTFVRRGQEWRAVAWQATRVPKPE